MNRTHVLIVLVVLLAACAPTAAVPTAVVPTAVPAAATVPVTRVVVASVAAPTAATPSSAPAASAITPAASRTPGGATAPAPANRSPETQSAKINLNTASDAQLLTVPNSGARMLREFREYRPWTSILQFRREIGKYVNAQQVAEYEKFLFVPIVPNSSDAATLQQLQGVTSEVAAKLISARPYPDKAQFIKQLGELVGPELATRDATLVETP